MPKDRCRRTGHGGHSRSRPDGRSGCARRTGRPGALPPHPKYSDPQLRAFEGSPGPEESHGMRSVLRSRSGRNSGTRESREDSPHPGRPCRSGSLGGRCNHRSTSASRLLQAGAARVIVGSETLPSLKTLRKIRDSVLPEQMLFSLDVGSGGVLSTCATLQSLQPLAALDLLSREGLSQVIMLTLNRVGTESGPDWSILESSRATFPHLSLIAGGGVRSPDDMWRLAEMGVDGILIATALHRGSISAADIDKIRLSR